MSEPAAPPPPPGPTPQARADRTWRLLGGLLLMLVGVAWLLEAMDVVEVPWDLLLPGALIAIGAVLVANARTGASHGGLIAVGVAVTVLLFVGSLVPFPIGGGIGERTERPRTAAQAGERFELGIGQLTVDLTELPPPTTEEPTVVRARVGLGQLIVEMPEGMAVRVEANVGLGSAKVLDLEESGFDVELVNEPQEAASQLELELSVGIGEVRVDRG
jgi:hypothetical protein